MLFILMPCYVKRLDTANTTNSHFVALRSFQPLPADCFVFFRQKKPKQCAQHNCTPSTSHKTADSKSWRTNLNIQQVTEPLLFETKENKCQSLNLCLGVKLLLLVESVYMSRRAQKHQSHFNQITVRKGYLTTRQIKAGLNLFEPLLSAQAYKSTVQ